MSENISTYGGCIRIVNTEFDADETVFKNNKGLKGGVIFAISKAFFAVRSSTLSGNMA